MRSNLLWLGWEKTLRRDSHALAVINATTGESLSRHDLHLMVLQLAKTKLACAHGSRIALCLANSTDWIVTFLCIQMLGSSLIPLDPETPPDRLESVARLVGADFLYSIHTDLIRLRPRRSTQLEVCIKLTSGSTGTPKKIYCHASHLLADGRQIIATMGISPKDRNLALVPLGHSFGLGNLVMPLVIQGTSLVIAEKFLPAQIPEWIRKHHITVFPSVPAIFRILSGLPGRSKLSPLRLAISAASVLSPETAAAFLKRFGVRIHNFYGSSETGGICYDRTGKSSLDGLSLGSPLKGVHIDLLADGHICVKSQAVAKPLGKFKLPDIGEWTPAGELRFLGRAGIMANVGGKKVSPVEIENLIRQIPRVTDAWVTVLESKQGHLIAAVVETPMVPSLILENLSRIVPVWKLPRTIRTFSTFPRTGRGKIDTALLAQWIKNQA